MPAPVIWTIGYESLLPPALVNELSHAGVRRLIDVRYRPQSRRAGMSKTRLSELLATHGIVYEHRRALGTPPDIRWFYKNRQEAEGASRFAAHIEEDDGATALDALAAELRNPSSPSTALLCLEADPSVCHRRTITEHLTTRIPTLRVIDL